MRRLAGWLTGWFCGWGCVCGGGPEGPERRSRQRRLNASTLRFSADKTDDRKPCHESERRGLKPRLPPRFTFPTPGAGFQAGEQITRKHMVHLSCLAVLLRVLSVAQSKACLFAFKG